MSDIQIIENTFITLSDGCKVAAKIWLPADAASEPTPAILEYIPYRKRDFKALRDDMIYRHFARHGYVGIRVDIRGSGDSEGVLRDEYLQQELDDGVEIINWIASQEWCDGQVGMMGISWGGFNGLQIAAMRPPALKAIITVSSTDNRYSDDVHYMGGCMLTDNLSWASTMFAYNSCPPDPEIVGEKWKDMWLERLAGSGLWLEKWLKHQRFDEYWQHGSVMMDYDAIQCPVYAISGWADGYSNSVFRLLENLKVPTKGLVGAWGHVYPHMTSEDQAIDFLNEAVRWWDRHLKGIDNGIDEEPGLQVWMQQSVSPISERRPGYWVAEDGWNDNYNPLQKLMLKPGYIDLYQNLPELDYPQTIQSPLSVGLFAGKWCSYSASTDLPNDQREEDGGALVYETTPLEEDRHILGAPVAELTLSSDKPVAMVAVRISDVRSNGRATRVTYGVLNLTHRDSDENPSELEPHKKYKVRVPMNYIAQKFPAGNQIRFSVSSSYWPLAWPAPEPAKITIYPSESSLHLPFRQPKEIDQKAVAFSRPKNQQELATQLLAPAEREWQVVHNLANNLVSLNVINNDPKIKHLGINWATTKEVSEKYSYQNDNYDTLRGEVNSLRKFERDEWETSVVTKTVLKSTKTHFVVRATLDAYEGDTRIYSQSWDERIERDHL